MFREFVGYFDDCRPDQRFTSHGWTSAYGSNGRLWVVHDWDQRRTISVATSWLEGDGDFIFEALAEHIDDNLPDAVLIEVAHDGEFVTCSSNADENRSQILHMKYPRFAVPILLSSRGWGFR